MARKRIDADAGFKPVIKRSPKNPLRSDWSEEMYTPAGLRRGLISESDARKEYTRLRDIAEKRIKRLGKSEFSNTQTYRNVQEGFKKLKDIKSPRELSMGLADLARFLSSDTSTVTGLWNARERALETMHQHGFTDINRENFALFGEFMEWARSTFDLMELGSNEVLNWFTQAYSGDKNAARVRVLFAQWMRNQDSDALHPVRDNMGPADAEALGKVVKHYGDWSK